MENENKDYNLIEETPNQWSCCNAKMTSTHVKYIYQISLGSSIVIFSMVQIMRQAENPEIYFSLISGMIGVFLPTPTM